MRITVLAGGVGSARFLAGLVRVVDARAITVVVNTGDDELVRGLHVSPDVDTVLYHLAGLADWERGWGVAGETFVAQERYAALAARLPGAGDLQEWFALGDVDLATHLLRARLLATGRSLSAAVESLRRAMGITCAVVPMSDDPAPTRVEISSGEDLAFQDYFVKRRQADDVRGVRYGDAPVSPAPFVLAAIEEAETVIVPPSNPILSVAPILAVDGVRDALRDARGIRIGISPIVGGRALKGPADRVLASLGYESSALGVARLYEGLLDVFVLDEADAALAAEVDALGMRAVVMDTLMRSPEDAARVAKSALHGGDA